MTAEQGLPYDFLFWAMLLGPGVLLALLAMAMRRSWMLWGAGAVLATLLVMLAAERFGVDAWNGLADRGYSASFITVVRASVAAGIVFVTLLILMVITRRRQVPADRLPRQEPLPAPGLSGRTEISRVPAAVLNILSDQEPLDAVVEAEPIGDRLRLQRRDGGVVGYLPQRQVGPIAALARRGGRMRFWVADRRPGPNGEGGSILVTFEESPRGSLVQLEMPGAPAASPPLSDPAVRPAAVFPTAPGLVVVADPVPEPLPPPLPPSPIAPAAEGSDIVAQLSTLASLKSSGALSEAEFDAAKRRILQL